MFQLIKVVNKFNLYNTPSLSSLVKNACFKRNPGSAGGRLEWSGNGRLSRNTLGLVDDN
jgi:hypothetical protein